MPISDFLKGFTPSFNEDSQGFEVLEGTYKASVSFLRAERNKDGVYDRYRLELIISEVIKGNGAAGRKLWKTYFKDNEESIKKLANDLFTSSIAFDASSDASFEASFDGAIGKPVYVRCWGWTPEKKQDGTPIPVEEREARQQFLIKSEKEALSGKSKKSGGSKSSVPF